MVDNLTGQGAGGKKPLPAKLCTSITDGLKAIYFQKVGLIYIAFHSTSPLPLSLSLFWFDYQYLPLSILLNLYMIGQADRGGVQVPELLLCPHGECVKV